MNFNLIDYIYEHHREVARAMYSFYNQKAYLFESLDKDLFVSVCNKHLINIHPSILFNFFEKNNVQLSIIFNFSTNYHEFQIVYMQQAVLGFDCESRHEAECRVAFSAIELLGQATKNGIELKYT